MSEAIILPKFKIKIIKVKNRKKFWIIISGLAVFCFIVIALYFLIENYKNKRFFSGKILSGEVVINSDSLGRVVDITCVNGYLIILDDRPLGNRGKVQIYDLNRFSLVDHAGKEGSGPGEIRTPASLNRVPGVDNKFSVFDISLNRLTVYKLSDGKCEVDKITTFEGAGIYYAHIFNDSIVATLDFLGDARISLYNFSGKKIGAFGELLPGKKRNVPLDVHKAAMQGKLKVSPNSDYCVSNATFSDYIDIYKDFKLLKRFHGPSDFLPRYNVETFQGFPVMAIDTQKAIWGYIDLFLTSDYIFALYSGNPFKAGAGGKYVHVYSYDGKLVKTYLLDREVLSICFNSSNKCFYCVDKSQVQIVKFALLE